MSSLVVTTRNARFQQWAALLANRTKRHRAGEFLVQGVRPISLAVEHGWTVRAWIHGVDGPRSAWARELMRTATGLRVAMAPELLRELGEKDEDVPELIAVVAMPPDRLDRVPVGPDLLAVVFDRPASPGNLGTLVRSADAFGADAVVTSGHGADPYDPKAVRSSTGSVFAVPVVRSRSVEEVTAWARTASAQLVGTDENGAVDLADHDFAQPTVLLVGNETIGLSAGWRAACDTLVRIPMQGSASSLNAASAATVVLYEAARQRAAHTAGAAGSAPP